MCPNGRRLACLALSVGLLALPGGATAASLATPPMVAAGPGATGGNGEVQISADGRWVLFTSDAADLVPGDHNAARDVFLHDRSLGATALVSRPAGTAEAGSGESARALMTPDARYVVFASAATNLVVEGLPPTGAGRRRLLYRWDRLTGEHRLINVNRPVVPGHPFATNALGNASQDLVPLQISSDGQRVLFQTGPRHLELVDPQVSEAGANSVFLWEAESGTTELLSGLFQTNPPETNLVTLAYSSSDLEGGHFMSDDGQRVSVTLGVLEAMSGANQFYLDSRGLTAVVVRGRLAGTNSVPNFPLSPDGWVLNPPVGLRHSAASAMSEDGWLLWEQRAGSLGNSWPGWPNASTPAAPQSWLFHGLTGERFMVSTNAALGQLASGPSGAGTISRDGNWVAYFSYATNLVAGDEDAVGDVYLFDRQLQVTTLVSEHPQWNGPAARGFELPPVLTPDGRFVLFQAIGSGLFRYDRATGTTALITTDVATDAPDISADGRFAVFKALPASIDPADTSPHRQVYCHDFETGLTELISRRDPAVPLGTPDGPTILQLAAVSATGRHVAYTSRARGFDPRANGSEQLWLRDLQTGLNTLVSRDRNGQPLQSVERFRDVQLSADGRWLCFVSSDGNLLHGDTNGLDDVFLFDRLSGFTRLVSFNHEGTAAATGRSFEAALARNGAFVAFRSTATNVVPDGGTNDLYLYEVEAIANRRLTTGLSGGGASDVCRFPKFSADGQTVVFLSKATNLVAIPPAAYELQPYWLKLQTGEIRFVGGANPTAPLFPDGASVSELTAGGERLLLRHWSYQRTLGPDVWLHDVASGTQRLVATNGGTVALAAAGDAVVFQRPVTTPGTPVQLFLRDLTTDAERLISVTWDGVTPGNGDSRVIGFAAQDRFVLFRSHASNLVAGDRNEAVDLFLHDRVTGFNRLVSRSGRGTANGFTGRAMITDDGGRVFFESYASDFAAHDHNRERDIFILQLLAPDSDGDQLPDDWELAYFDTLARGGAEDADGDGASDLAEFRAGTSPTNEESVLRAIALTSLGTGEVTVWWQAVPGKRYRVEFRDEIGGGGWQPAGSAVVATGDPATLTHLAATMGERYYRVVLEE